jgi:very-short-patch-repair endonuclease
MLLLIKSRQENPSIIKLKKGSHVRVYAVCDFCGAETYGEYRYYYKGKKEHICNKTACVKCKYKKAELTNEKLYGTKIVARCEYIKEKKKKTCLKKYGVEYNSQRPEYKEKMSQRHKNLSPEQRQVETDKRKKTLMEKYGVEYYSQLPEYRDKRRLYWENLSEEEKSAILQKRQATHKELWGGSYASTEECKQKIRATSLKRYGVNHYAKTSEYIERVKRTNLEKYGVEWVAASPEIMAQRAETNIKLYGTKNPIQNPEIAAKAKATAIERGFIKLYNGKRITEWAEIAKLSRQHAGALLRSYGPEFLEKFKRCESDIEQLTRQILESLNLNFTAHAVVGGRKTDFLIEESKLIIECDGLYWHNDKIKDREYHKNKKEDYKRAGYRSLFFRQDEIIFKSEIVKSIISQVCNLNVEPIFASQCEVVELDGEKSQDFFAANHLNGNGRGKCFGLSYRGDIVSAIQLNNRGKNSTYEISRFCTSIGRTVVDGFCRLIEYIETVLNPSCLYIFIDQRYDYELGLEKSGFYYSDSYLSFKWTDNRITLHRSSFPGSSGYDNGFNKIWDCGQAKFIKSY